MAARSVRRPRRRAHPASCGDSVVRTVMREIRSFRRAEAPVFYPDLDDYGEGVLVRTPARNAGRPHRDESSLRAGTRDHGATVRVGGVSAPVSPMNPAVRDPPFACVAVMESRDGGLARRSGENRMMRTSGFLALGKRFAKLDESGNPLKKIAEGG